VGADTPLTLTIADLASDRYERLSSTQKLIAAYLVDQPLDASRLSARQIADRTGTSAATVVRLARALGFDGLPAMQRALLEEDRENGPSALEQQAPRTPYASVLRADLANLLQTADDPESTLPDSAVAADAILAAESVLIVGEDELQFPAGYFRHLLSLIGLRAETLTSRSAESTARLERIDARTVVIALSLGHSEPLANTAMQAGRAGLARVAISGSRLSEVARLADIQLVFASVAPGRGRSLTALMSVLQGLAHEVSWRQSSGERASQPTVTADLSEHNIQARHAVDRDGYTPDVGIALEYSPAVEASLQYSPAAGTAWIVTDDRRRRVDPPPKARRMLLYLLQRYRELDEPADGVLASHDELKGALWYDDRHPQFRPDSAVASVVWNLRRTLGDEDHRLLETVRGTGYRLQPRPQVATSSDELDGAIELPKTADSATEPPRPRANSTPDGGTHKAWWRR